MTTASTGVVSKDIELGIIAPPHPISSDDPRPTSSVPPSRTTMELTMSQFSADKDPGDHFHIAASAQNNYINYLKQLKSLWKDLPNINISYKNLSMTYDIPVNDTSIPSLADALLGVGKKLYCRKTKTYQLSALDGVTGHIKSGEMSLVLAPPGHGKSMLLKGLAGRLNGEKGFSGEVEYNGMKQDQLKNDTGYLMNKLAAYVGQADTHMSLLTVKETFEVALKHSVADVNLLNPSEEFIKKHHEKVSMIIDCLGLTECTDTIIGNDLIRGVSGGQKKRVTIGEMMIGNYRVLLLDEITTGLDAAMAFDILKLLREWTRITGGSVVAALLQPTPEMYELFDNIILLREGASVYSGPRSSVLPYLSSLGIHAPDDQDDADFLVDFLTDPPLYFAKRQQRELKKLRLQRESSTRKLQITSNGENQSNGVNGYHKTNGAVNGAGLNRLPLQEKNGNGVHTNGDYANGSAQNTVRESSVVIFHLGDVDINTINGNGNSHDHSSNGKSNGASSAETKSLIIDEKKQNGVHLRSPSNAPVTTAALKAAFQKSSYYASINNAIRQDESSGSLEQFKRDAQSKSPYTSHQFAHQFVHSQLSHALINIQRQLVYMKRNNLMIFPRIFSAIFMGVCIGTLYIQLNPDKYIEKVGLILFGLIFLAFSNMAELPISEELKDAVGKQLDAGFYPAFTHVVAVSLPVMPLAAVEATIFGSLIYWVSGFNTDAGRFFFFLLLLFLTNIVLGTIFRAVSYLTPNQVIAQQMGGPITVMTFLFGGFLVTEKKIPDFLIEFFWLSPFSWTLRSASNNEFNDGRYSDLTENGIRKGDSYLQFWEIRTDNAYKWAGVGYSIGLLLVFSIVCSLAVKYMRYEVLMGTKRPPDEEEIRAKLSLAAVQLSIRQESERNMNGGVNKEAGINGQSVLPFTPTTLTWSKVHYTIPVHGKDRKLLKEVSGFAEPGVLTALMGASGAGKTTLMDVLAGRKTMGTLEGTINVNGEPFQSVNYRRLLGYVEQNDLHMPLDTVRQALLFSAKLRLPASITDEQREKFVDEIIDLLELTPIANRIIGNDAIPGIAGWQKKLVTIGVELVANPSIICLDEPTSSLDSRAAIVVMRVIRKIASTGRAVLCTIHQPSAEVFYMFDRLLLLKSGGETVYFGPIGEVNAENLVQYLEDASNNTKKIPPKMNPASWMLDVIGAGTNKTDIDYAKIYADHPIKLSADKQLQEIESSFKSGQEKKKSAKNNAIYAASFVQQYLAVQYRAFTAYYRNVPFNLTRIILINLLGLIFGLVYLNTRDIGTDAATMQSKIASIYMTIGFSGAIQCMIVVPVLLRDRSAYYRERSSSMYSDLVYSLATFIVEVPYVFIATIMFNYSYYFMVGLDSNANLFWKWILASFLNSINFTSVGHLMAAAFPNFVVASQVQGILMTFFFLFGGTFIRVNAMPKGWIWMYFIDPLPKAIIAAMYPQFECEGDASVCPYIDVNGQRVTYSDWVTESFDTGHGNYWRWIGWLVLTVVVFRIIIALCLRYISHIRR